MSGFWVCVKPPATGPLLLCLSTRTWPWISECSCLLLSLNTCNRDWSGHLHARVSLPQANNLHCRQSFDSTLVVTPWHVGTVPKGNIGNLIRCIHLAKRHVTEPCQGVQAIKWRVNTRESCIYSEHASNHTGPRTHTHTHTTTKHTWSYLKFVITKIISERYMQCA